MKRLFLLFTTILVAVMAMSGQHKIDPAKAQEIFNAKVKYMQEALLLTDAQTEQFIPVYKQYLEDVKAIKRPDRKKEAETADEAAQKVVDELNFKRGILNAQEVCINKLKTFLSAPQLLKFTKAEQSMQRKLYSEKIKRNNTHCTKGRKNK